MSPIVLLQTEPNLTDCGQAMMHVALWPHFRGQISCNWDSPTWVKVTLLFLLCRGPQNGVLNNIEQREQFQLVESFVFETRLGFDFANLAIDLVWRFVHRSILP